MKIKAIPPEVVAIIKTLTENKFEAYAVGGCVRDSILGKAPRDWDITTAAKPDEVKKLFRKTIDTGIKHGTITVIINNMDFEITTFRSDGEYLDNRRPNSVEFTTSLKDDLSRRDFTMNAIAYHSDKGFIDPFNGIEDINRQLIRAVGNADKRFKEDALRILRAIRFSAQLNFTIEQDTLTAIKDKSYLISNISQERIRQELTKLLISETPMKFLLLKDTDILQFILPEFNECFNITQNNPYHVYNVAMHCLHSVSNIENTKVLRWAMLLHDIGKAQTKTIADDGVEHFYGHVPISEQLAEAILIRLKFDSKTISLICRLIHHHDRDIEPTFKSVRKALNTIGEDIFSDLLKVKIADAKAQNPSYLNEKINRIMQIEAIYNEIKQKQECISIKSLAVDGQDLIDLGFPPDKRLGLALKLLLDAVIENPELNEKQLLLQLVKTFTF